MPVTVSAIIVNYNSGIDLANCLRSLIAQQYTPAEIIIVDNASSDESMKTASSVVPAIISIRNRHNKGFAAGANDGARVATSDVLLFLNPDIELAEDSLATIVKAVSSEVGVVGPRLVVESDVRDEYGSTLDLLGHPIALQSAGSPLYVSGCALATPRDLFQRLGGFDERYFMFVEDVDYCWRVLLTGADVTVASEAIAFHQGGGTAAGGYVRSGRLATTDFRVQLRERNTLAMYLKCGATPRLLWFVPIYLAKYLFMVILAILLGRIALARGLIAGIVWNTRQLPETLRRRRAIQRDRSLERGAMRRLLRRLVALELVLRFGLPRFADNHDSNRAASRGIKHD